MNIPRNFGTITQAIKGEFDGREVGATGVDDGDLGYNSPYLQYVLLPRVFLTSIFA